LGLCQDSRSEIDVSGVAKIPELDGVDDSFFEFTEIDLREINSRINNVQKGIIQLESCGDVNLPVNADTLLEEISKFRDMSGNTTQQNVKTIEAYYLALNNNELPVLRGHQLTEEDLIIRKHILNLMCQFETSWSENQMYFSEIPEVINQLNEMEHDGFVEFIKQGIQVTEKGKPFVRNICMAFDLRLKRKAPETELFSMTI
jgi:hypothetical protein